MATIALSRQAQDRALVQNSNRSLSALVLIDKTCLSSGNILWMLAVLYRIGDELRSSSADDGDCMNRYVLVFTCQGLLLSGTLMEATMI